MGLRFGIDIGVASVGWAVVNDEYEVVESGANLFPSADASKNVDRRTFRQMKRVHRRRKTRVSDFDKLWKNHGRKLPESNPEEVLELRVKGLTQALTEEELYAVLKNALLHRGISYLDDAGDEAVSGRSDYERGIMLNRQALDENMHPCEIQFKRLKEYGSYRGNLTIDVDGEKVMLSNVFTTGAYRKEIFEILERQQESHAFLTDDFVENYLKIFSRKREYYVGPGNEKSRTDYGKYTTRINAETGQYVTEDNIFEKLIGKCSVYKDLTRAAGATYTAQEFNLLNDLNNLTVNGRKLEKEEKVQIIEEVKTANTVNMRKILKRVIGEELETLTGARIDKKEKELFHHFEQYNAIRKAFEKQGWDISELSREDLDSIGDILTLNTERESILGGFQREGLTLSEEKKDCLIALRKKSGALFSKWQSFSLKIMQELIPELYAQPKNQMQLLTDMGVFKTNQEKFAEYHQIPDEMILENIYNPVVSRSVRITVKVLNALVKKYGNPSQIVIEMPRDNSEEEEKKRTKEIQAKNEKELEGIVKRISEEYGIKITEQDFHQHKKLVLKLKLWQEQDGICVYSGRAISIQDLLKNPYLFEIDHIIPKSISFDDSRTNKVLVYRTENQEKRNQTPYLYLKNLRRSWGYDEYRSYVLELKRKGLIPKAKLDKLLFTEDITKIEVLKGFLSRNLNDTRYASRMVLNILQSYFKAKKADTTIRVVRGSFTHQLRNVMRLEKDREESYAHHAVDAMLMCYSQMGFDAYHARQKEIIDFETGEILDENKWNQIMSDKAYDELMYQNQWMRIRANIQKAEKEVKYWHKRDSKPNRGLCNQTIRGTREKDGATMKVNKLNIYEPSGWAKLKKMIEQGKQERFLMYLHDRKTWDDMLRIIEEYQDAANPFVEYEKETGDYLRKYAKKHNGPRIRQLKYLDGEVGSCIDISHKYGHEQGSRKVILESLNPYRMDVYYHAGKKAYFFVGVKYADLKFEKGRYILNEEAYQRALVSEKLIAASQNRFDLEELGYRFVLSFYRNEIIEYEKDGEYYTERFLSRTMPKQKNYIETKPMDAPKFEFVDRHFVGLRKTKSVKKIRLDILGNRFYCSQEKFILEVDAV